MSGTGRKFPPPKLSGLPLANFESLPTYAVSRNDILAIVFGIATILTTIALTIATIYFTRKYYRTHPRK